MLSETFRMTYCYLSAKQHFPLKVCVVWVHFVEKFWGRTKGSANTVKVDPTELSAVAWTCTGLWESQRFLQFSGLHVEKSRLLSVMISQWCERKQLLLQSQWERLWTHTIFFFRYRLCVWGCACTCKHLTGLPIIRQSLKQSLCSCFLCFTYAPLDTTP